MGETEKDRQTKRKDRQTQKGRMNEGQRKCETKR